MHGPVRHGRAPWSRDDHRRQPEEKLKVQGSLAWEERRRRLRRWRPFLMPARLADWLARFRFSRPLA